MGGDGEADQDWKAGDRMCGVEWKGLKDVLKSLRWMKEVEVEVEVQKK